VRLIERTSPSTTAGPELTLEEQIVTGDIPVKDDEYIAGVYLTLLDRLAPELRVILETAVDAVEHPLLFHCAAGKDRTGLVAAVLLGVLGVPDATIIEDYELSSRYWGVGRLDAVAGLLHEHGVSPERIRHLVEARRPALDRALRHVHGQWGGWDGFAIGAVGVPADLPGRLRSALTLESG
jgi:protein-tyrosine phosphatase